MTDEPDRVLTATDDDSGLTATLRLERGDDEAVSAVAVEIANPTQRAVTLTVNADVTALLLVEATDQHGDRLSRPARKFASDEAPELREITLSPGSSRTWRTELADWIAADRVPAAGVDGRLVVSVAFAVDDRQVLLTLHDMRVRLSTR